ncbi:Uncharacterised protein [uncultured archaeon]|nr:Uncharacterised protein [uncultured archaeon]
MGIKSEMSKKIYLICPVRKVSKEIKLYLDDYVENQELQGNMVHYPHRDVNQNDPTGMTIMLSHRNAMEKSDEVHAYWVPGSEGSVCDLGMVLMAKKPLKLINKEEIENWLVKNPGKSYTNVVYELDANYRQTEAWIRITNARDARK